MGEEPLPRILVTYSNVRPLEWSKTAAVIIIFGRFEKFKSQSSDNKKANTRGRAAATAPSQGVYQ